MKMEVVTCTSDYDSNIRQGQSPDDSYHSEPSHIKIEPSQIIPFM